MSLLRWMRDDDPDAEYWQVTATTPRGTKLTAFGDRDGTEWGYRVGDAAAEFGSDSIEDAKTEAEAAAKANDLW
jgi:hypothetical protein